MSQLKLIEEETKQEEDELNYAVGEPFRFEWETPEIDRLVQHLKNELDEEEINFYADDLPNPSKWFQFADAALEIKKVLPRRNCVEVDGVVVRNKHEKSAWEQVFENCKKIGKRAAERIGGPHDE